VARRYASGCDPRLSRKIIDSLATGYAVALVAAELARATRRALPSEAFTAGLFHNIAQTFWFCAQAVPRPAEAVASGETDVGSAPPFDDAALTRSVCGALGLTVSVVELVLAIPPSPIGQLVRLSAWVVARLVRVPAGADPRLDAEGRALGMDDDLWKTALSFSASVRELVSSYGAVA
jgi:hypothetical protein